MLLEPDCLLCIQEYTCGFRFVRDDTAHEVRVRRIERRHQTTQLFLYHNQHGKTWRHHVGRNCWGKHMTSFCWEWLLRYTHVAILVEWLLKKTHVVIMSPSCWSTYYDYGNGRACMTSDVRVTLSKFCCLKKKLVCDKSVCVISVTHKDFWKVMTFEGWSVGWCLYFES